MPGILYLYIVKQILPISLLILPLALGCGNKPAPEQTGRVPVVAQMTDDTLALTDTMTVTDPETLTEEQQLQIFKALMKDLKPRKLYDFSMLTPQNLSSVYANFELALLSSKDSLKDTEVEFYKDLFARLEEKKQAMEDAQAIDIKLKLQIARYESHIESFFANRISGQISKDQ